MFQDRLNALMEVLGANNKEIAMFAGFDRTNLSHMRSGKRVPRKTGDALNKLIDGLYLYADKNQKLPLLCDTIGAEGNISSPLLKQKMINWLFQDEDTKEPSDRVSANTSKRNGRTSPLLSFSERLNTSMQLADISNIRLSQLIHIDASLISRYRRGLRTPGTNPELMKNLGLVLYERILKNDKKEALADIMSFPANELDLDDYSAWLFERLSQRDEIIYAAEKFLTVFDSYKGDPALSLPETSLHESLLSDMREMKSGKNQEKSLSGSPASDIQNMHNAAEGLSDAAQQAEKPDLYVGTAGLRDAAQQAETPDLYVGTAGFQNAVLRFLENAYQNKAKQLFLYSDESQDWLTSDPAYLQKWTTLMAACVKNGTRICIIHNVDRDLNEMNAAIQSWFPLYMSGMIESYYFQKRRNVRFSHTIFLNPKSACIEAFHVSGNEKNGLYHYYTDSEALAVCEQEYRSMLNNCHPLLKPGTHHLPGNLSDVILIQDTLPIATMPEILLRSFQSAALDEEWKEASGELMKRLDNRNNIYLCVPLFSDKMLYSGKAPVELAAGMKSVMFYTPEQYGFHIRHMIRLMKEYPNLHFYPLTDSPFPNMKIWIADEFARITHASNPALSFGFSHPMMCRAFREYAKTIMEQCEFAKNNEKH